MKSDLVVYSEEIFLTKDVDVNGCSGSTAAVGGLYDVGGAVVSLGLADCDSGVSWLGVNGHSVVWFKDLISLGPFHTGFRFTSYFGGKFDFAASFGGQTSQQFGIQLDLWGLYMNNNGSFRKLGIKSVFLHFWF